MENSIHDIEIDEPDYEKEYEEYYLRTKQERE